MRLLVNDPAIFGERVAGSPEDPAVRMESIHTSSSVAESRISVRCGSSTPPNKARGRCWHASRDRNDLMDRELNSLPMSPSCKPPDGPPRSPRSTAPGHRPAADNPAQPQTLDYFCNNPFAIPAAPYFARYPLMSNCPPECPIRNTSSSAAAARIEIRQEKEANWRRRSTRPATPADRAALSSA